MISLACLVGLAAHQTPPAPHFSVLAFYSGRNDLAHVSFVQEANRWFPETASTHDFRYESTTDWTRLNADSLKGYQVVVFLDTRPDDPAQREAFRRYMEGGGAWLGFHFSGFALTPSDYPQNWDWYHDEFLGSGQYVSNTWRPTSAMLRVEAPDHPVRQGLPATFDPRPTSGIGGNTISGRTRISASCSRSILRAFRWDRPQAARIWHSGDYPSCGRTRAIGWST